MTSEKVIYTIGSSRRTEEEFIEILRAYDIAILVDVRSFPRSKLEHFSKENLLKSLEEGGIRYIYLGKELGGFRKGGYELYTHTEDFSSGILKLEEIASQGKTIFMCTERFPWKCHRRYISRELNSRGWKVIHIIEKDRVWVPGEKHAEKQKKATHFHKGLDS
jgi:uncharacterized protein (DUF488 family)